MNTVNRIYSLLEAIIAAWPNIDGKRIEMYGCSRKQLVVMVKVVEGRVHTNVCSTYLLYFFQIFFAKF